MMTFTARYRYYVNEALRRLDIRAFVLAIHDLAIARAAAKVVGERLLRFTRTLGFNAVQCGPQGVVSRDDASPYDSTIFSRSLLSIALDRLVEAGLLKPETLADTAREHEAGRR